MAAVVTRHLERGVGWLGVELRPRPHRWNGTHDGHDAQDQGQHRESVVGSDEVPPPIDDHGWIRLVRSQKMLERLTDRRHVLVVDRPLLEQRRESSREQQPVSLAKRDLEALGEMQDHLAARFGAPGLDET